MSAIQIREELRRVRQAIVAREASYRTELSRVHTLHRERARNLVHYVAFRECASETFHRRLETLGLDPLRDAEWDVLPRLDRVIGRIEGEPAEPAEWIEQSATDAGDKGREMLRDRTLELFGPPAHGRDVEIMVTLPSEAAEDPAIVKGFLDGGADCFRINCARDSRQTWERLIVQLRAAESDAKRSLLFMDLGGAKLRVASFSHGKKSIRLGKGDSLFIRKSESRTPGPTDGEGIPDGPAISVSDPTGLAAVLPGHRVWFDDGRLGGVVRDARGKFVHVEITHARNGGRRLRLDRGVNLPDTSMNLPALTEKDLLDLTFGLRHADFLALSFIRGAVDVTAFLSAISRDGGPRPAMVVKLETREAWLHLPEIMLAAMQYDRAAMLLARGDLAVECGLLELPRIQNDVLRYCAAASLPLFWATGVLERASRTGEPTRAEITDAHEAARAQCVMLNKGPHIRDALRALKALLEEKKGNT